MATADLLTGSEFDRFESTGVGLSQSGPAIQYVSIEFRHLRYFVGLAEELHFGRAATRLFISQPGLSQAVARMEHELDVKLFERTRRNVELTDAGAELLHRARRLLADHEEALARVRSVGQGEIGSLRLGIAWLSEPLVERALGSFGDEHAGIALDRTLMVSDRLLDELRAGRLDIAFVHQLPVLLAEEELEWEPLRRGPLAVVASRDSALARHSTVTLGELSGETFVVNPRAVAPGAFEGLKLMCREFGGFDANVLESAVASMVAAGAHWGPIDDYGAIMLMAEPTARAADPAQVAVIVVEPPPLYTIALAWRRGDLAAAASRFVEHLRGYRDEHGWLDWAASMSG